MCTSLHSNFSDLTDIILCEVWPQVDILMYVSSFLIFEILAFINHVNTRLDACMDVSTGDVLVLSCFIIINSHKIVYMFYDTGYLIA